MQNLTWEGDNNVLYLQTGRFLVKALLGALSGKPVAGTAKYLENLSSQNSYQCSVTDAGQWLDTSIQLEAFQHRAMKLVARAGEDLRKASGGKLSFEGSAWDNNTLAVIKYVFTVSRKHIVCLGPVYRSHECLAFLRHAPGSELPPLQ